MISWSRMPSLRCWLIRNALVRWFYFLIFFIYTVLILTMVTAPYWPPPLPDAGLCRWDQIDIVWDCKQWLSLALFYCFCCTLLCKRDLCCHVMSISLSICPSVINSVKTSNCDGDLLNTGVKCGWGRRKSWFSMNIIDRWLLQCAINNWWSSVQ